MNIETKDMWFVNGRHEKFPITAIVEKESGNIVTWQYKRQEDEDEDDWDDDWYKRDEDYRYFNTEGQCIDYINERRKYLREAMPKVKELLKELGELDPNNEQFKFKKEDYLPGFLMRKDDYWREEYYRIDKICDLLIQAVTKRTLSINAEIIRIDDVVGIK